MRVLIACEESQEVCKAFRELGHEAFSCDILPCSGGHPEWHIQDDVLNHLNDGWDLMIAHPPCTYLSYAATKYWNRDGRVWMRLEALRLGLLRSTGGLFRELCQLGWSSRAEVRRLANDSTMQATQ